MSAVAEQHDLSTSDGLAGSFVNQPMSVGFVLAFLAVIALTLFNAARSIYSDSSAAGGLSAPASPFLLLGVTLLIAAVVGSRYLLRFGPPALGSRADVARPASSLPTMIGTASR